MIVFGDIYLFYYGFMIVVFELNKLNDVFFCKRIMFDIKGIFIEIFVFILLVCDVCF